MVASSNLKAVRTKPSGAEKKRAKIRREFMSNLLISTPDHPDVEKEKSESKTLRLLIQRIHVYLYRFCARLLR